MSNKNRLKNKKSKIKLPLFSLSFQRLKVTKFSKRPIFPWSFKASKPPFRLNLLKDLLPFLFKCLKKLW